MKDYEHLAVLRAEKIGVYAYQVNGNLMVYESYFGSEGFYHVEYNLDTGEETREHIKAPKGEYNYFTG